MGYRDYCIFTNVSVRDAMSAIDHVVPQIVFLTENDRIIASLTDGDVRRYILNGGSVNDLAIQAANTSPLCARTEAEAAQLFHQRNYVAVPVVNEAGVLVDVYVGGDDPEANRNVKLGVPVVINAGGKGTRLEPFTKILPKPLIPVGELPIVEHIMHQFMQYGCDDFSLIVNYKKELLKAYFSDSEAHYKTTWYNEEKPLGTGGGLCFLKGKLDSTFFFTNCDNLLLANYESIYNFHKENHNTITMICAYKNFTIPYGVVELGENGSIQTLREKPEFSYLTNTGIYVVEPEVLEDIEDDVEIGFPDIVERERAKGKKVLVYPVSGDDWLDMGQLSELENMRKRLYGE